MSTEAIFLIKDGEPTGPFDADDVRAMVARDEVNRQRLAWREGSGDWRPLEQLLGFDGLPPLPAPSPNSPPKAWQNVTPEPMGKLLNSPLATISGGLGILLVLLSVFSVGSCVNAQQDLKRFVAASNSPAGLTEQFVNILGRGAQGDFGGVFENANAQRALEERINDAEVFAWLCLVGVGVCAIFFVVASRKSLKAAIRL